ncbi:hypothetical protein BKA67DRAFT_652184 [Truncatella angustata]|uniref:Ketoreductase (KR) domain-containing protein n=1 Tax=Truncatella angustata TaxID=152316 RepID=A0A9P9A206_9PEZI|nr:uncharacterized protein BKA67DRAFT_652184 [Truncatella angustata]KAH6658907.1 hypothetical protein BKA67DRAFT_652184 [Truncatella angustata]
MELESQRRVNAVVLMYNVSRSSPQQRGITLTIMYYRTDHSVSWGLAELPAAKNGDVPKREFCVSHGTTFISRLTRTRPLNDILGMSDTPEPVKFALRDRIFGWELHGKVVFKQQDDTANEKVEEGHVKTQVQGNALTNGGVLVITGSDYPLAMKLAASPNAGGLFHPMPYGNWKTACELKVSSAMNLYSVLADVPLGFFLMTSSVLVVLGTPAYRRVRAGSSTTACVLLMVLRIAVVAENVDLGDILKPKGRYGIDEEHLLQPFGASIAAKRLEPVPDHVVIGLDPALWQKAVPDGAATDSFWLKDARCSHVASYIDSSRNSGAGAAHRASWQP